MRKYSIIILFLTIFVLCKEQAHAKFISDEGTLVQRGVFLYYILDNKEYRVWSVKLSRQLLHRELLSITAHINKVLTCTFKDKPQVILTTFYGEKELSINVLLAINKGIGGLSFAEDTFFDTQEEFDYWNQVGKNALNLSKSEYSEIMTLLLKL